MSKPVITVENLGKAYLLGRRLERNATLRDQFTGFFQGVGDRLRHKLGDAARAADAFWAVRHATFEVPRGEVLGLIGRNGAGKSTLLKMLSRITDPTEGRAIIRGRVASLLEVGTGFHPELSGRENIFLNGAILGMKRVEIQRKFDEIVAFSEVEKFLDTPVKRYSSGMYVRLAFAVAAHLEPEVLIVDEVLAVGDASFQKKCLGKMGDVMRQGRTVLFVSHNMDAVTSLCTQIVLVKDGRASQPMPPEDGVQQYLAATNEETALPLAQKPRTQIRPRKPVFTDLKVTTDTGHDRVVASGGRVTFEVELSDCDDVTAATLGLAICNHRGQRVAFFHSLYNSGFWIRGTGKGRVVCDIPSLPLVPGTYYVELVLADTRGWIERIERADKLDVVFADVLGTGIIPSSRQSAMVLPCEWQANGLALRGEVPEEVGGVRAASRDRGQEQIGEAEENAAGATELQEVQNGQ